MTVNNFVYRKIYLLLFNFTFICVVLALLFEYFNYSLFLEWNLGGSLVSFTFTFYFDTIGLVFLRIVSFISANVVIYSYSYLLDDSYNERFILLVLGFVFSMIILIISPNILRILLGWDGLGLVSYCLVIYYPTKKSSAAGMLTVLRNRVGDICLLVSIGWVAIIGEFNFIFLINGEFSRLLIEDHLGLLLVCGAITKRAQIPFSAWLPAAIAAPTPVSALVHSSTLVTAGVYLLIRFSFFLRSSSLNVLFVLSVLTIFIAGLVASFEFDIKKIIALSTLSQLGVMMFSISLGLYKIAFFHLVAHALFKALLFLCAGSVIHGFHGSQDIRNLGGVTLNYPLVSVLINLSNLSLCGIPFISGFYSKDMVVEFAVQGYWNFFLIIVIYLRLGLTVFYSIRLSFYSFINVPSGFCTKSIGDKDVFIMTPIMCLSLLSLISGPCLSNFLFFPSLVFLDQIVKCFVLVIIFRVIVVSFNLFVRAKMESYSIVRNFQGLMWGIPFLSGQVFSSWTLKYSINLISSLEFGWTEWGSVGIISNETKWGKKSEEIVIRSFKTFLLIFIFWFFLFILWVYF